MPPTVLGRNLKTLMDAHEILRTQAAVAKAAGMDQTTVGRILAGSHSPRLQQIEALAEVYGLAPWQLLVPNLAPGKPPMLLQNQAEIELFAKLRQVISPPPPPRK